MWTKCASFLPICFFFISAKFMKDATTVICEPFTLVFFTSVFRYINEVLYLNEPINSATNNSFIHVFLKLTAQRITAGTSHTYSYLLIAIISGHSVLNITTNGILSLSIVLKGFRYQNFVTENYNCQIKYLFQIYQLPKRVSQNVF
jgi:hypothetical protein